MSVNDEKYIKAKVREFKVWLKSIFILCWWSAKKLHYACIPSIAIDGVMRTEKKNYPQVYLEECKYIIKKTKIPEFIDA